MWFYKLLSKEYKMLRTEETKVNPQYGGRTALANLNASVVIYYELSCQLTMVS